jgi:putative DNA primase/helicase
MINDPKVVVGFPGAEDRARKVRDLVETRARMSEVEWLFYLPEDANRLSLEAPALKQMIEAQIKANEKLEREKRGELRERERKREHELDKAERKRERDLDKAERAERREREEAAREERRAQAEREKRAKALEAIVALQNAEHESELKKLAERRGESLDSLRPAFDMLLAIEREKIASGEVSPWPEPVDTRALLKELTAQIEKYVVIHQKEAVVAVALWIIFAWCHDVATYSPMLVIQAPDIDSAKTNLSKVIALLTPRSYVIAEPTGAALYRFVDNLHPTLILDDADRLLPRRPDLAHIINVGWTRDTAIIRTNVKTGHAQRFDTFCPKISNGINLLAHLKPATRSRCIAIDVLPKLEHEKVTDFRQAAEDTNFYTLRCKLARWAADNMEAIKRATLAMPRGVTNRLEQNWKLLLAIADLASGDWPKRARAAALRLTRDHNEPSYGKLLLAALRKLVKQHGQILASEQIPNLLVADDEEVWGNYRGHPINKFEVAALLKPFGIRPSLIWRGKKPIRGYKAEWFATAWKHFLPPEGR